MEMGCYTDRGVSGYCIYAKLRRKELTGEACIKKMAEEMMLSIAGNCRDLGARAIGHIKCYIHTRAGTIKADTIGVPQGAYSEGRLDHPVQDLSLSINSAVSGIPEDAVKAATLEAMCQVSNRHGFSVKTEREQTYFDAFDTESAAGDRLFEVEQEFDGDEFEEEF
jgi:hypothetical protein